MIHDQFVRSAWVKRFIDADTLELSIDLGWGISMDHTIRLEGVNTPEATGKERKAGQYVTDQVMLWMTTRLNQNPDVIIRSIEFATGKYGRCICRVYYGKDFEVCLNEKLLEEGLGWPIDKDGAIIGERSLERLHGLPKELRVSNEESKRWYEIWLGTKR